MENQLPFFYFFERGKKRKIYVHNANSFELNQLKNSLKKMNIPNEEKNKYIEAIKSQESFLQNCYEEKKNYFIEKVKNEKNYNDIKKWMQRTFHSNKNLIETLQKI
jgi:hypothetical protein